MIAKSKRLATHDFILIFIAAAIVIASFLPLSTPRREVRLRDATGEIHTYALELNDPMLARLREAQAGRASKRSRSAALAVARWQAETAGFYAARSEPPTIRQVSFSDQVSSGDQANREIELNALESQQKAWLKVRLEAEEKINQWVAGFESLQILETPSPVELGGMIPAHRSLPAYLLALLGGVIVAGLFSCWTYVSPTVHFPRTVSEPPTSVPTDPNQAFEITFSVPRDWIRIRQSPSVWLRRATELTLVITAIFTLAA